MARKEFPECDTVDITTDGSGDGTGAITFKNPMPSTDYSVVCTIQEADITGQLAVTTKTVNGCTIVLDGSAVLSGVVTVAWMAKANAY